MVDCFSVLLNQDIIGAALCPFTNIGSGFEVWFFALIILGIEAGIYIKTGNLLIPSTIAVFISAATLSTSSLINLPAEFFVVATIIMILNIATIIFGIFKSGKAG